MIDPFETKPWTYNPSLGDFIDDAVASDVDDGWLMAHSVTSEMRSASLRAVFLDGQPRWQSAFTVMLVLAAGIASLGLSQNSAATVIGSMIIAPLGQPIVALGAALVMLWAKEAVRLFGIILVGALGVVAVAYLIGLLLPVATPNAQILSRTAPDLRDLGVALFAGAAGAYAYTRDELSGVLPGVAISVALVPPLAAVGLMLEEGRWVLAQGATTLFATNLIGIAVAAGGVMLVTGFAPTPRLKNRHPGVVTSVLLVVVAVVGISIPLSHAYSRIVDSANIVGDIHTAVDEAVGSGGPVVEDVDVVGDSVTVTISDAASSSIALVADAVRAVVGSSVTVTITGP